MKGDFFLSMITPMKKDGVFTIPKMCESRIYIEMHKFMNVASFLASILFNRSILSVRCLRLLRCRKWKSFCHVHISVQRAAHLFHSLACCTLMVFGAVHFPLQPDRSLSVPRWREAHSMRRASRCSLVAGQEKSSSPTQGPFTEPCWAHSVCVCVCVCVCVQHVRTRAKTPVGFGFSSQTISDKVAA